MQILIDLKISISSYIKLRESLKYQLNEKGEAVHTYPRSILIYILNITFISAIFLII